MSWRWLAAAGVVSRRACVLKGLIVTPSAATAACTVYNGESDQDPVAFSIAVATQVSRPFNFPDGLELDRGLYVGNFTNITGVLVIWEPKG
jgi:hypothetical protein